MRPLVLTETVLSFAEVVAACPVVAGRRPTLRTIYAWADSGILVGAERVRLESAKVGGRRVTSVQALERFLADTSANGPCEPVVERTPAARLKASEAAAEFLAREFAKVK